MSVKSIDMNFTEKKEYYYIVFYSLKINIFRRLKATKMFSTLKASKMFHT